MSSLGSAWRSGSAAAIHVTEGQATNLTLFVIRWDENLAHPRKEDNRDLARDNPVKWAIPPTVRSRLDRFSCVSSHSALDFRRRAHSVCAALRNAVSSGTSAFASAALRR
jgi:hypothetical protein